MTTAPDAVELDAARDARRPAPALPPWSTFVRRVVYGGSQALAAEQSGIDQTTISRWVRGERRQPSATAVVSFARGYGLNPLDALVAAGYLTADEAGQPARGGFDLSLVPTVDLAEELARRAAA